MSDKKFKPIEKVKFDIANENVEYHEFYNVNPDEDLSLKGKENDLFCRYFDHDMLLIGLNDELCLDVGWYPQIKESVTDNKKGSFRCQIIKNEDWECPVEIKEFSRWEDVKSWVDAWIVKLKEME